MTSYSCKLNKCLIHCGRGGGWGGGGLGHTLKVFQVDLQLSSGSGWEAGSALRPHIAVLGWADFRETKEAGESESAKVVADSSQEEGKGIGGEEGTFQPRTSVIRLS